MAIAGKSLTAQSEIPLGSQGIPRGSMECWRQIPFRGAYLHALPGADYVPARSGYSIPRLAVRDDTHGLTLSGC